MKHLNDTRSFQLYSQSQTITRSEQKHLNIFIYAHAFSKFILFARLMSTMTEEDRKMAVYTANRQKYNYTLAVLMAMRNDFEPEKFLSLYDDIHNRYPMLIHNHVIDTAIIIWKKSFVVPDKDVSFYYRELYKYHFNMVDALNGDY